MRCGDESIENEIEQKILLILNEAKNMKNSNEQKNVSLNVFRLANRTIDIFLYRLNCCFLKAKTSIF